MRLKLGGGVSLHLLGDRPLSYFTASPPSSELAFDEFTIQPVSGSIETVKYHRNRRVATGGPHEITCMHLIITSASTSKRHGED